MCRPLARARDVGLEGRHAPMLRVRDGNEGKRKKMQTPGLSEPHALHLESNKIRDSHGIVLTLVLLSLALIKGLAVPDEPSSGLLPRTLLEAVRAPAAEDILRFRACALAALVLPLLYPCPPPAPSGPSCARALEGLERVLWSNWTFWEAEAEAAAEPEPELAPGSGSRLREGALAAPPQRKLLAENPFACGVSPDESESEWDSARGVEEEVEAPGAGSAGDL